MIGQLHSLSLKESSKESQLCNWLIRHKRKQKDKFIVVFDGHHQDFEFGSQETVKGIHVIYTDITESADHFIIRKLSNYQVSEVTIVSSDSAITTQASRRHYQVMSISTFIKMHLIDPSEDDNKVESGSLDYWLKKFT